MRHGEITRYVFARRDIIDDDAPYADARTRANVDPILDGGAWTDEDLVGNHHAAANEYTPGHAAAIANA